MLKILYDSAINSIIDPRVRSMYNYLPDSSCESVNDSAKDDSRVFRSYEPLGSRHMIMGRFQLGCVLCS